MSDRDKERTYWCADCGYTTESATQPQCCGPHAKRHPERTMTPIGEGFDRTEAHND